MPSLQLIRQFQKSIGVDREEFLHLLEHSRGAQNATITAFYKQLLDDLIAKLKNGDLGKYDLEQFLRNEIRRAVGSQRLTNIMLNAMRDDFERIGAYLNTSFSLLDRRYKLREARILARDRLSDYIVSGGKNIGNRLAVEIGALSQSYSREELYDLIDDKINVTGARVKTVTDNIIRGYDAEVTDHLAQQTGLRLWTYEGTLIEHSRRFCIRLVNLPYCYTKAQILQMNNGMHLNPFTFRGGYNCRHAWAPGEEGWPGFEHPYPKAGPPFVLIAAEGGSYRVTVPQG